MNTAADLDMDVIHDLVGRAIVDAGGTVTAALVVAGDRLGLFAAMADGERRTPGALALQTNTTERYVREWLNAMAASGYVTYHKGDRTYALSPEQQMLFAHEHSPAFIVGAFQVALAAVKTAPKLEEAFRTGRGIGWHEHDHALFHATERFFRPGYAAHLTNTWIPALDGVEAKLRAGASVADVGCGFGASTILMAQAYPDSVFVGFDYHEASVTAARERAEAAGVSGRVRFEVATAQDFAGAEYDLVTMFDALHDMGDPSGAARHVLEALAPDGTWLVVEPYAGDDVEDNLNPVGRIYYAVSTLVCTPGAMSQEGGMALGAQAGEARLRGLMTGAGFTRVRRAAETPVNLIIEARP